MKRKIAVCGNGWNNEYLKVVMSGIRKCAAENNTDIFFLMNYSINEGEEYKNLGDTNIFKLIDHAHFDGIILLGNSLHLQEEYDYLCSSIQQKNIPAICLEYQLPDMDCLGTDNYSGMYELCEHLITQHNAKQVLFLSGPADNLENMYRRKALEDVLTHHNLSLASDNIIYGNWNYYEAFEALHIWVQTHNSLPDAVVCANDVMAMAACSLLKGLNIRVPEDVKVTGFDHLASTQTFSPVIASVDRNWDHMGYQATQHLINVIDGKPTKLPRYIDSKAVLAESCGCQLTPTDIENADSHGIYANIVSATFWSGHLCDISECLSRAMSDQELHNDFNVLLEKTHAHEGDELYLCLVDNFFSTIQEEIPLHREGYTTQMDVVCGIKDGLAIPRQSICTADLIPNYNLQDKGGKLYTLIPLYSIDGYYGYAAFGNELDMMYDYSLYNWARNIRQNLEHIRQNIMMVELNKRLERLSVTDGLTGVYNRSGCEKIAYPYLARCHTQGKRAVLMFADINKMKVINDKYGHLQGDLAICTVAKTIKEILTDDWIIVRYGGDEFLMVGEYSNEMPPQKLLENIGMQLEHTCLQMNLPYPLKVGVGYVLIEPNEKLNLSEYLKLADEAMYLSKMKQQIS